MRRVQPAAWQPTGVNQLEPNAWKALRYEGSSFVAAGPGTGKTEFLAQRADYLFLTGLCPNSRSILAISFKRDAALNLANRVSARTPNSIHRFNSLTFDAFTKGLVDRFRAALPKPWRMSGDYEVWYPSKSEIQTHLADLAANNPEQAHEIAALRHDNFVNEVIGTHVLPISLSDIQTAHELASLVWWDRHFRSTDPQRVDFVMLNRLAELIIRANPAIHRALLLTYPYVFIDEFQDTTFAQYSFLRSVFGSKQTILTAVGDDKQRIMGWAGALEDAFADFQSDFAAQRFDLNWNFRSAPKMTKFQHVVANNVGNSVIPAVSQVTATVEDNPLKIWHFEDVDSEARSVAKWISEDVSKSGRTPNRYALLARQKTADFQLLLERELSHYDIQLRNDDACVGALKLQDLLSDELAMRMLDLIRLAATRGGNGDAWMRVSDIISRMHDLSRDDETLSRSHRALETFVACLRRWMLINPPGTSTIKLTLDKIVSYLRIPAIQSAFPAHRQRSFLDETLNALKIRLDEMVEDGVSWEDLCDLAESRDAVPLMTIHKSKGLEYHTVIFLGLDDTQWWSIRKDPLEAIRTFFVCSSRAEQRMIFTYCMARGGRQKIEPLYDLLAKANVEYCCIQP